jgi:hypothetical protein
MLRAATLTARVRRNIVRNVDKSVGVLSLAALESGLDMHYRESKFHAAEGRHHRCVHGPTRHSQSIAHQENYMKRLALVAAVLVAACSTAEKKADTAAPAMAPAPAATVDTVKHDTTAAMKMDTAMKKADTAAKAAKGAKKKP